MSIFSGIAGKVVDTVGGIIKESVTDKDLQNKLLHDLDMQRGKFEHDAEMAGVELAKAQIAVNLESAKSPSLLVAGARPFCIWSMCCLLIAAVCFGVLAAFMPEYGDAAEDIENLVQGAVLPPFMLLLGARTVERYRGVARNTHKQ